jgi:succinyl-CoA synthetase beta subunit
MLEINPLASLTDGRVLVCDSKAWRFSVHDHGNPDITLPLAN